MSRFSKLDFDSGEPHLKLVGPENDPWPNMDEDGCLKTGDARFATGLYEDALTSYSRALRFNKGLAAAWVGQIRCLLCLGELPEAVTWSDRALERFGENADLLACKGLALVQMGDVAEGTEYLDGAIERRAPSAWVWLARGEALLLTRQPDVNAQRCFLKALELTPDDRHLELRVGMAFNRARLFARARAPLCSAARTLSDNPLLLLHLGLMQEGLGELALAAGFFQRALAVRRDFPQAASGLSRTQGAGSLSRWWRRFTARGGG